MELAKLADEFKQIKQEFSDKAINAVNEEFKKIFDKYPDITCIKWAQYTPYFNDGDTCEFDVYDWYITNGDPDRLTVWGDYDDWNDGVSEGVPEDIFAYGSYYDKEMKYEDIWKLEKFAGTDIGSEVFYGAFGDHCRVTVTKDGIAVEGYDHD